MSGSESPPSALPAPSWLRFPLAVPSLAYRAPSLADATLLAGFAIDHACGCSAGIPVVFPQNLLNAGGVVSVLPVLALPSDVSFMPVELTSSAAAANFRCSAALVCFWLLCLVATAVPVATSPREYYGLSLLMFFSMLSASEHGIVSARPGDGL